jgi:hypothetical protein
MIASPGDLVRFLLSIKPIPVSPCTRFLPNSKNCLYASKIADFFFSAELFQLKDFYQMKEKIQLSCDPSAPAAPEFLRCKNTSCMCILVALTGH